MICVNGILVLVSFLSGNLEIDLSKKVASVPAEIYCMVVKIDYWGGNNG